MAPHNARIVKGRGKPKGGEYSPKAYVVSTNYLKGRQKGVPRAELISVIQETMGIKGQQARSAVSNMLKQGYLKTL